MTIASNESFGGWTKTFTGPRLWAAIVDRLSFGGNILKTGHRLLPARPDPGPAARLRAQLTARQPPGQPGQANPGAVTRPGPGSPATSPSAHLIETFQHPACCPLRP